jgi:NAD(P)H-flavin reductase
MDSKEFEVVKELLMWFKTLEREDCVLVANDFGSKKTKELVKEAMRQTGNPRKYKFIWSGEDKAALIVFLAPAK